MEVTLRSDIWFTLQFSTFMNVVFYEFSIARQIENLTMFQLQYQITYNAKLTHCRNAVGKMHYAEIDLQMNTINKR